MFKTQFPNMSHNNNTSTDIECKEHDQTAELVNNWHRMRWSEKQRQTHINNKLNDGKTWNKWTAFYNRQKTSKEDQQVPRCIMSCSAVCTYLTSGQACSTRTTNVHQYANSNQFTTALVHITLLDFRCQVIHRNVTESSGSKTNNSLNSVTTDCKLTTDQCLWQFKEIDSMRLIYKQWLEHSAR